jgi:transcriptional regulator with XRE-family HTH domain
MQQKASTTLLTVPVIVRSYRQSRGMSATGLAKAAGLSPSYVSKIERRECEPSFKAFSKIALVLEIPSSFQSLERDFGSDAVTSTSWPRCRTDPATPPGLERLPARRSGHEQLHNSQLRW